VPLHQVKLVFWNRGGRKRGGEVRTGYMSALTLVLAARQAVADHRRRSVRPPDEVHARREDAGRVLWVGDSVYSSEQTLGRGIGEGFTLLPVEDVLNG
jgi:hypothetical protein